MIALLIYLNSDRGGHWRTAAAAAAPCAPSGSGVNESPRLVAYSK